ncbi:MAG: hypothetical protein JO327_02155 [Nitrososphaeraceae archaeon]|nr:hypothetical protein [Nitrososphaeraceae archaeon]MBV9666914.1 hypothetical protein [Nitrososphaeraceae archaeon]
MNHTISIVTIMLAFSLFFVVLTNPYSYAQQIPSVSSTHPKTHAVRITSPNKGQQVPIGKDLSVSGISSTIGIGNTTTKTTPSTCQAYVIVNGVKPYQQAKGTGQGGAADYSKWNFVLTSKYAAIKPGPANKITAKYVCSNNPASASFYSVNVTGVGAHVKPALIASTHTPTNAPPHAQVLSSAPHTHSLSPTATALKQKEQQPVVAGNSDRSTTLNTPSNPAAPKSSVNYAPKPVVTPTSSSSNIGGPVSATTSSLRHAASVAMDNNNTTRNNNTGTAASTHTTFESGKLIYLGSIKLPGEADNSKSTVLHNSTSDKSVSTISSHNTGYYSAVKTRDHHDNNNGIPSGYNSQQVCSNYGSDTIVCSNGNSQNAESGKYLDQLNHPQEASTNNRSISGDNSITAATGAIITLPARTIPSQSATMTLTAQLNTPMTISIPGVGKVMATASQPIEGRTCPSISYQVNSDIGMLCLRIDWYTLS